jgi:cell division protein FtsQ
MTVASAVTAAAGFRIENVKITGQSQTSEVDVLGALDIGTYPSLLTLDIEAAKARIEALPWVRQATLVKLFPDSLDIAIAERDPFALWQHDGLTSLVDRSGRVIAETSDERYAALPRVVGAGAAERVGEYTALLQAVPAIAKRARAGVLVSERRWNVVLDNGIEVMLPPDGAEAALERVAALDASRQLLSREVAAVDVRDSDRLVLRLTEAGQKAVAATARQRGRS